MKRKNEMEEDKGGVKVVGWMGSMETKRWRWKTEERRKGRKGNKG